MNKILDYLEEPMKYLSFVFAQSIPNNVSDKEDLYQDLIVFYLENKDSRQAQKVAGQTEQKIKNYWYICFKRYLLNKYTRAVTERKVKEKIYARLQNYKKTRRPFIG